jgi:predicted metal-dependent hydrolase
LDKALHSGPKLKKSGNPLLSKAEKAFEAYPFAEISPHLNLKINPRAKRMALRVDIHKRVVNLVLPKRASLRTAYLFAYEHRLWIREKVKSFPAQVTYQNGVIIPLLGKDREILLDYDPALKTTSIQLTGNVITVSSNKEDPSLRIRRFLIDLAKEELSSLSHEKAALIGKKVRAVSVRDTSSRWGSCTSEGKLSYSWRLIFAPREAFDYVVAHEVAHLKHLDHSPAFWHVCEDLSADYSAGKTWMKRHSQDLIRYL